MTLHIYLAAQTAVWRLLRHLHATRNQSMRSISGGDRGQTTAEYALVIIGAAAVAMLLLAWATGTGKITDLFDKVVGAVARMVQ